MLKLFFLAFFGRFLTMFMQSITKALSDLFLRWAHLEG